MARDDKVLGNLLHGAIPHHSCTCHRRVPALVVLPYAACACGRDSSASRELAPVPTMAKTASESKHMVKNGTMEKAKGHQALCQIEAPSLSIA